MRRPASARMTELRIVAMRTTAKEELLIAV